jgi:hypothetical protein
MLRKLGSVSGNKVFGGMMHAKSCSNSGAPCEGIIGAKVASADAADSLFDDGFFCNLLMESCDQRAKAFSKFVSAATNAAAEAKPLKIVAWLNSASDFR